MLFPSLKLVYFDFEGRAEATRLALFLGDVPFRDVRVPFHDGFSTSEQAAKCPYAMLPVLEVDGVPIAESIAMLRFAGRLAKLYPVNDATGALLTDEVLELIEIFTERCLRWERETDETQQKLLEHALTTQIISQSFQAIDAKLAAIKTHPTFASASPATLFVHDLAVRSFVRFIIRPDWEQFVGDRSTISHWLESIDKVENHPKVKTYYALEAAAKDKTLTLTEGSTMTRGEPIRKAVRMGDVTFEDLRVDTESAVSLKLGGGRVVASFFAILRHVGTLTGLYPAAKDALLSFRIDELLGQLEELHSMWYYPANVLGDTVKECAFAEQLANETIPKFLTLLDRRVGSWAAPHATGSRLTIADLAIDGTLDQLTSGQYLRDAPAVQIAQYGNLKKIRDLVQQLAG